MPAPNEGTKNLPRSIDGLAHTGVWDETNQRYLESRGTHQGNVIVQLEKGAPVVTAVTVGTASAPLLAANATRRVATFLNNGTATVYISQTSPASTANGYPIPPGVEFVDDLTQVAWYAISGTAGQDMRIIEVS
jgi:hypothetical protein